MTMRFGSRRLLLPFLGALCGASWLVGFASPDLLPLAEEARTAASLPARGKTAAADPAAEYRRAMALLQAHHHAAPFDESRVRSLTYEAIRGMTLSLGDPFSSFLDPEDWNQMQATTRGDFDGIGIVLQQEGGTVRVAEVIETSPAEKAGVKAGDIIARINGQSAAGWDMNRIVRRIGGSQGTRVRVGVQRGNLLLEFALLRTHVVPPIVKWEIADPQAHIARIVLTEFNERSMEQLQAAFEAVKRQGAKAVVFDLRGNPGGLLDVSIEVASAFIPRDAHPGLKNAVVYVKEGTGEETHRALRSDCYLLDGMPLVVLVNSGSASASEIVTAAIQDYGVGTILGERTYGKGKVQTLFPLDDSSALRLTTGIYYSPKHTDLNYQHDAAGRRIADTGGIVPEMPVKQPTSWQGWADRKNDAQLKRGLEVLRAKLGVEISAGNHLTKPAT